MTLPFVQAFVRQLFQLATNLPFSLEKGIAGAIFIHLTNVSPMPTATTDYASATKGTRATDMMSAPKLPETSYRPAPGP